MVLWLSCKNTYFRDIYKNIFEFLKDSGLETSETIGIKMRALHRLLTLIDNMKDKKLILSNLDENSFVYRKDGLEIHPRVKVTSDYDWYDYNEDKTDLLQLESPKYFEIIEKFYEMSKLNKAVKTSAARKLMDYFIQFNIDNPKFLPDQFLLESSDFFRSNSKFNNLGQVQKNLLIV